MNDEGGRVVMASAELGKSEVEEDSAISLIGALHQASLKLFPLIKDIVKDKAEDNLEDSLTQLRRDYMSCGFWGVLHSVPEGQLDRKLDLCKDLQQDVISVLLQLLESLYQWLLPSGHPAAPVFLEEYGALIEHAAYVVDGQFAFDFNHEYPVVLEDISVCISALDDLDPVLQDPTPDLAEDFEQPRPPAEVLSLGSREFYFEIIHHRFPNADPKLVKYHSSLNYSRLCRMQDLRHEATRGKKDAIPPATEAHSVVELQHPEQQRKYQYERPVCPIDKDCQDQREQVRLEEIQSVHLEAPNSSAHKKQPEPDLASSRYGNSYYGTSLFHDSGLGSSIGPKTSYAESVVSVLRTRAYNKLLPKMPDPSPHDGSLKCSLCHHELTCASQGEWNKHVIEDIRPYVCIYDDCEPTQRFHETRADWVAHLTTHFERYKTVDGSRCVLCLRTIEDAPDVVYHFEQHLLELSILACPVDGLLDDDTSSCASDRTNKRSVVAENDIPNILSPSQRSEDTDTGVPHSGTNSPRMKQPTSIPPSPWTKHDWKDTIGLRSDVEVTSATMPLLIGMKYSDSFSLPSLEQALLEDEARNGSLTNRPRTIPLPQHFGSNLHPMRGPPGLDNFSLAPATKKPSVPVIINPQMNASSVDQQSNSRNDLQSLAELEKAKLRADTNNRVSEWLSETSDETSILENPDFHELWGQPDTEDDVDHLKEKSNEEHPIDFTTANEIIKTFVKICKEVDSISHAAAPSSIHQVIRLPGVLGDILRDEVSQRIPEDRTSNNFMEEFMRRSRDFETASIAATDGYCAAPDLMSAYYRLFPDRPTSTSSWGSPSQSIYTKEEIERWAQSCETSQSSAQHVPLHTLEPTVEVVNGELSRLMGRDVKDITT